MKRFALILIVLLLLAAFPAAGRAGTLSLSKQGAFSVDETDAGVTSSFDYTAGDATFTIRFGSDGTTTLTVGNTTNVSDFVTFPNPADGGTDLWTLKNSNPAKTGGTFTLNEPADESTAETVGTWYLPGNVWDANSLATVYTIFESTTSNEVSDLIWFDNNGPGGTAEANFQSGTPEPTTLTLCGLGVVSLLGYGWRRRKVARA
jgi:hypothetical protein